MAMVQQQDIVAAFHLAKSQVKQKNDLPRVYLIVSVLFLNFSAVLFLFFSGQHIFPVIILFFDFAF
jgi:hypothetical protein